MAKRKGLNYNMEELTENMKQATGQGVDAFFPSHSPTPQDKQTDAPSQAKPKGKKSSVLKSSSFVPPPEGSRRQSTQKVSETIMDANPAIDTTQQKMVKENSDIVTSQRHNVTSDSDVTTSHEVAFTTNLDMDKLQTVIKALSEIPTASQNVPVRLSDQERKDIDEFIHVTLRRKGITGHDVSVSKLLRYSLRYILKVHEKELLVSLVQALKKETTLPI